MPHTTQAPLMLAPIMSRRSMSAMSPSVSLVGRGILIQSTRLARLTRLLPIPRRLWQSRRSAPQKFEQRRGVVPNRQPFLHRGDRGEELLVIPHLKQESLVIPEDALDLNDQSFDLAHLAR